MIIILRPPDLRNVKGEYYLEKKNSSPSHIICMKNEVKIMVLFPPYHTDSFYKRITYTLSQRGKQISRKSATRLAQSLVIVASV